MLSLFRIGWRWNLALTFFVFAMIGLSAGVSLTERPEIVSGSLLTKAYYSLGLFVVGGLDIGTPVGGPLPARILLWIAFFGSPLLAASTVVEAVLSTFSKRRWHLRRVKDHIVIVGAGYMTSSFLRVLRERDMHTPVIVVARSIEEVRKIELKASFGATVIVGDVTHEFLLKELRLHRARRVLLLGADDFRSFEAASKIFRMFPRMIGKVVIHCSSLRFLRATQDTQIAQNSERFNSYNLAAAGLVRNTLLAHFRQTQEQDTVILAGFGLFGQTILEELLENAPELLGTVVVMDIQANRRLHIVEEQRNLAAGYHREVFEGDISHPEVWRELTERVDLSIGSPVLIFGTGDAANNLRTALWVKKKFPNALVFSRTDDFSEFALEVGADHGLVCISITNLVEENIPKAWLS
ncbi:MAG: Trk K+ transport system NAD-binding subunit [Halieaceae bacterium]|jgi:Trk K+ transport system NAD-binding subunit